LTVAFFSANFAKNKAPKDNVSLSTARVLQPKAASHYVNDILEHNASNNWENVQTQQHFGAIHKTKL
jgi:hypothetical protein